MINDIRAGLAWKLLKWALQLMPDGPVRDKLLLAFYSTSVEEADRLRAELESADNP